MPSCELSSYRISLSTRSQAVLAERPGFAERVGAGRNVALLLPHAIRVACPRLIAVRKVEEHPLGQRREIHVAREVEHRGWFGESGEGEAGKGPMEHGAETD